jgi:hypothetical protein
VNGPTAQRKVHEDHEDHYKDFVIFVILVIFVSSRPLVSATVGAGAFGRKAAAGHPDQMNGPTALVGHFKTDNLSTVKTDNF